jgi:flagellar biogenesis protein FliO
MFMFLLPGILRAQTQHDNKQQEQLSPGDLVPPLWAEMPNAYSAPVRVPPPVPPVDQGVVQARFDKSVSSDDESNISKSATGLSPVQGNKRAVPLSPPNKESRISLTQSNKTKSQDSSSKSTGLPSMVTVIGSLGVVLGLFMLVAWLMRRSAPQAQARLPNEAFEVLGRAPLLGRQNVHLLRCGNKLLLVSITPAGTETLTEIIDPQEVDRLAGLCRQSGPQSSTAAFQQVFEQLAPKRPIRGAFSRKDYSDYYSPENDLTDDGGWENRNV